MFTYFKKNIQLELIKKKRSGIFTLSVVLGTIIPLFFFIVHLFSKNHKINIGKGIPSNFYFEILKDGVLIGFSHFLFPILIIIIASKIAQIDHKNKGWNLMETQPTTKKSIFFSKYFILLVSNCIAIVSLLISIVFFSYLLTLFCEYPDYLTMNIPFKEFVVIGMRLFIIGLGVTAMQYMLSVLISSFIWPLIIGFIGMSLPLFLKTMKILINWYPFQQLADVGTYPHGSELGYWFTFSEVLSVLYTSLFLFVGYSWYYHKTFIRTFFTSKKRSVINLGIIAVLCGLVFFVATPKQQVRNNKTIVKGTIIGDNNMILKNIYILDGLIQDTIAKIPVIDHKFRAELTEELPFDTYWIQFDHYHRENVFFGKNDSLDIDFKILGKNKEIKLKGTRLAENIQVKSKGSSHVKYLLNKNIRLKNDEFYVEKILAEWEEKLTQIDNKKTVDNYIPSDDYLTRQYKIISLEYLNYWNEYKKKLKKTHPNKKIKDSLKLAELEVSVSLDDANLLSNNLYLDYILKKLIKKDDRIEVSDSQKHFEAIDKLESSSFKDRLIFNELKTNIEQATEIKFRDSLVNKYLSSIQKESYKELLRKELKDQNRLTKGKKAPQFVAENTKGKSFKLDDFKGKFLLIDIWGNWCQPCLKIAPKFKKKALTYRNKNIVFAKMNFHDSKNTWKISSKEKDTLLLDLKPKKENKFKNDYKIKKFPTFILIDPEGKLISSDFARPDMKLFDELLNKYLEE